MTKNTFLQIGFQHSTPPSHFIHNYYNSTNRNSPVIPVVLVNFNILKNISKFLQNVVVLDL
ncbi:hypothetical protein DVW18_12230, partial [Enterococcus faecium]